MHLIEEVGFINSIYHVFHLKEALESKDGFMKFNLRALYKKIIMEEGTNIKIHINSQNM